MKLFHAAASPFVRKVMITAIELGLDERIELLASAAHPVRRDPRIIACNPLGKVPTLITEEGLALYDSSVICEYLDSIASPPGLFPSKGSARWSALRDQALAGGVLDAGLLVRYENAIRPEDCRYQPWIAGQMDKIATALRALETLACAFGGRVDIGTISVACALGYLDFRYQELDWRRSCPEVGRWFADFSRRESMQRTVPGLPSPPA